MKAEVVNGKITVLICAVILLILILAKEATKCYNDRSCQLKSHFPLVFFSDSLGLACSM